jgi:hypothetical protein
VTTESDIVPFSASATEPPPGEMMGVTTKLAYTPAAFRPRARYGVVPSEALAGRAIRLTLVCISPRELATVVAHAPARASATAALAGAAAAGSVTFAVDMNAELTLRTITTADIDENTVG